MDTNYIFLATRCIIRTIEYDYPTTIYHTKRVGESLFYIKNGVAVDLLTKEKLPTDYSYLKLGEQFVDLKGDFYSLKDIVAEIETKYNVQIQLRNKMSRRKLLKFFSKIYKQTQIKEQEKEESKKLIKIIECGGKK